ncbi:MAG: MBL fold metallo-hydrolase [Candidatus Gracilibacteria bacterium]
MDITWHGESCFTIKGKKGTVVTNPFASDVKNEKLKADVIIISEIAGEKPHKLAPIAGEPRTCDVPGEFEVSEVPVIGMQIVTDGVFEPKTVFQFRIDDISVCFLGKIDKPITAELIEKIGDVDVLMIPVGGNGTLDAKKAQSLIEEIEPRMVVPMCYDDITAFLKNTGVTPEVKDTFAIANKAALPQDKTEYVVLNVK